MAITSKVVKNIAQLAQLKFSESQTRKLLEELSSIIGYVEKLNELDTKNVEPQSHTSEVTNVMREDEVQTSLTVEEALKNAPASQNGFFKVPKVIK